MLVLSRKQGQSIIMTLPDGRKIVVKINELKDRVVRMGVSAPSDVKIRRDELKENPDDD